MKIPTSKKELLDALVNGAASLRREIVEFLTKPSQDQDVDMNSGSTGKNDSVIDVTNETYIIPQKHNSASPVNTFNQTIVQVPYWEHQYVYSYSEIYDATKKQREFYDYFKYKFLNKEFVDLDGNTNYSFILLFDLLNAYKNHRNLRILEEQLRLLGEFYPRTNTYALNFLAQNMESAGDYAGAERIRCEHQTTFYDYWKLGSQYKTKLSLTDDEVKKLNRLSYSTNNFTDIEYCCKIVIGLYLAVIGDLESGFKTEQSSLDEQLEALSDIVARKHYRYRKGSQNYNYCMESTPGEICSIVFKHCENAVRDKYAHKRKLNVYGSYTHPDVQAEFEGRFVEKLNHILPARLPQIDLPDEETEIELNAQNTTRWKLKFNELTNDYNGDGKQFVKDILNLGKLNSKNPSIENIFFEASKFISKTDHETALILYIYYLHHDLKSASFDNKQLSKTIQKSLFKTNEQLHDFEMIISEFIEDRDVNKAVQKIPAIYAQKRKKIRLDSAVIHEVQQQHSGTVEILNEYLQDEYEGETNTIKSEEISSEEIKIEITPKSEPAVISMFISEIALTALHCETLELFFKNGLTLPMDELETFVKTKGAFKNQLIDSLNEACYEILDDVLIEEDDEYYIISENYYRKLLAE
jgi:hypothetical protein